MRQRSMLVSHARLHVSQVRIVLKAAETGVAEPASRCTRSFFIAPPRWSKLTDRTNGVGRRSAPTRAPVGRKGRRGTTIETRRESQHLMRLSRNARVDPTTDDTDEQSRASGRTPLENGGCESCP
jgi:hypothetical protein